MQTLNILPRITTSFWKPNTEIKRYMKILKTISFFILLLFSANLQSQTFSACVEGTISVYGDAELSLCQGDGLEDEIRFRTSPLGTPVGYIVVDENDIIVHVSSSSRIDFEELPNGNLRVYSVSYIGQFTAMVGENYLESQLGSFCGRLSGNFITVSNLTPDGGAVTTTDGETALTLCIEPGVDNLVNFTSSSSFTPYLFVVTDDSNRILGTSTDGMVDFTDAEPGVCRVWGVAYVGDFLGEIGDDLLATNLATACFELSSSFVEVTRLFPEGGSLSFADGTESFISCSTENPSGTLELASTHSTATDFVFVIIGEDGAVYDITTINTIDLAVIPSGSYRIFGLAYTGNLSIALGDTFDPDAALSDECFDLSDNQLSLIKRVQDAGDVSLEDGATEITLCVGDGIADELTFNSTYMGDDNLIFVITDDQNVVLDTSTDGIIDFEGAGAGVCRVWALVYSGNLSVAAGDDIDDGQALSNECFDLSDNFVLINRNGPDGGVISYADGSDAFTSCSSTDPSGTLSLVVADNDPNADYTFLLVNEANVIVVISANGTVDLATLPDGTYTGYGVSYIDGLAVNEGDPFDPTMVGANCFDLSDNTVSLVKRVQDAGDVSLEDGSTEATICVGDGNPDVLTFNSTYTGTDNLVYIITDDTNTVLDTSADGVIDFEGADTGVCRVWGLVYSGNLTVAAGDNLDDGLALSDECFDLSNNFATINRNGPEGGTISLADGSTSFTECMAGGSGTVLELVSTDADPNLAYSYIVVDSETDAIAAILDESSLELDQLGLGTFTAYGVSYLESLVVNVGDAFTGEGLADVCFDLSDNTVEIVNRSVSVNEITFEDGSTVAAICPDDGTVDILNFVTDYTGADNLAYLITDTDNTIIEILAGPSTNFEDYDGDFVRVWAVAFSGNFLLQNGVTVDANTQVSSECYDITENFLLVDLRGPDGATVSLEDGSTEAFVCVSDGQPDVLSLVNTAPAGSNYLYIITDEDNIVLNTSTSPEIDFEDAPAGICRIWGLAYLGDPTVEIGANAAISDLATDCFDLSDNFVVVIRTFVDGGTVSLEDGSTQAFVCSNDGEADFFIFTNTSTATDESYAYIITDDQENILAVLAGNSVNLDQAAPGECHVWGLSYTGTIIAEVGQNALEVPLTDDCYELSENFVTMQRDLVDGGNVSLEDGSTLINICPNDGVADLVTFVNDGTSTASYTYIMTDVNNNILGNLGSDPVDFDMFSAPAEVRIWGLAFNGQLQNLSGDIQLAVLSNVCYNLSDNFVTIIREQPEGGTVSTTDGETTLYLCTDDGIDDLYSFASSGASNTDYVYLITDENNIILNIIQPGDEANFEGAPNGNCRVWGLAYTGNLTAAIDDNAAEVALSDDCFDLSDDFVDVIRGELNAGTVESTLGTGDRFTCPGDGEADVLTFFNQGTGSGTFSFVLTDANNVIVQILADNTVDFETLPEGEYRLWGLVFTGDLLAGVGTDAGAEDLATACFDLSDNFITVFNIEPAAGLVFTESGEEEVSICIGDGIPDPFDVTVFGASDAAFTFLVVDEDSILVGTLDGPTFDFEQAAPGDWRIYGLSYTGSISILPGGHIFEESLSSGCFDLSNNFIFVDKTQVDGGQVFTDLGETVVYTCPDGVSDFVSFINSSGSSEADYTYVLTTQTNIVLQVLAGNTIDVEQAAGLDALRMWGVSYTGDLTLSIGNIITDVSLSTGCNDLSESYVDIFIGNPDGGTLSFEDGSDFSRLCHSNFMPGIQVNTTSTANVGYAYILTDTADVVIEVSEPADGLVNLDNVEPGTYRIYAVSYTGSLLIDAGQEITDGPLASSCHELSTNFVTVERTESLDGGNVSTSLGEEIVYICPQDGVADIVILENDTDDPAYRYIITDDQNRILFGDVESNVIDFDPSLPGICRVYGVVYTGTFDPTFMADITSSALSDDCWALSNNYITLVRQQPEGGTVSTEDGSIDVEFITNDGEDDIVTMINTGIDQTPYIYVITDTENVILDTSADGIINFEGVAEGVCRIWGLSYTGSITAIVGDDADEVALSDDCYDLSDNFVTVTRINDGNFVPGTGEQLSLSTEEEVMLSIYPNPARETLNLQLEVPESMITNEQMISLYDLSGKLVFQQQIAPQAGQTRQAIDISQLRGGLYILHWYDGERVVVSRFIKE